MTTTHALASDVGSSAGRAASALGGAGAVRTARRGHPSVRRTTRGRTIGRCRTGDRAAVNGRAAM